jgi:predicted hydrocarbon binding protein
METKCIGLGDPYCELRIFPGASDEVKDSLKRDSETVSCIHQKLIDKYVSHITDSKTLTDRPEFGPDIHLQIPFHTFGFAHMAGDRSQMALRMGGVKSGMDMAERMLNAGMGADEVVTSVLATLETLKAGIVTVTGSRLIIEENIEPLRTWYMTRLRELSCHFTSGFLNGLYQTAFNLRVNECRCVAAGDTCCEWEIV